MNQELRDRTILPIFIPVAAIVVTEIVVFSMSRVLLATGGTPAVVIALGTALAILIGAAAVAGAKRIRTTSIVGLLVVGLLVAVGAGAVAIQRGPSYEREEAANRPVVEVSAKDLAFDSDTLKLVAGGTVIDFTNADAQPHNIAIYPNEASLNDPLFKGAIIPAAGSTEYEVPAIRPGEYYFQCDVHPTMKGTASVEPGAPPPDEG